MLNSTGLLNRVVRSGGYGHGNFQYAIKIIFLTGLWVLRQI
jgi:hypothetical protein